MKGLTPIIFDIDIHRILKLLQLCENVDKYKKTSCTSSNLRHPDSDKKSNSMLLFIIMSSQK